MRKLSVCRRHVGWEYLRVSEANGVCDIEYEGEHYNWNEAWCKKLDD